MAMALEGPTALKHVAENAVPAILDVEPTSETIEVTIEPAPVTGIAEVTTVETEAEEAPELLAGALIEATPMEVASEEPMPQTLETTFNVAESVEFTQALVEFVDEAAEETVPTSVVEEFVESLEIPTFEIELVVAEPQPLEVALEAVVVAPVS